MLLVHFVFIFFFFFNDTATTEIYTLSLHDALPTSNRTWSLPFPVQPCETIVPPCWRAAATRWRDRKSTRLNSSHVEISYAVFCLKKKTKTPPPPPPPPTPPPPPH